MNLNKLTKKQSGVIFLIVYGLTFILGLFIIFLGLYYGRNIIITMLIADIIMTLVIFIVGLIIKNASLYDPYWSVVPPYLMILWALSSYGFQLPINVILLIIAVCFWGVRLTYNWWKNWTGFSKQDWRYDYLREKNPKLYPITNLFGIHMIPTAVVFLQMINVFDIMKHSFVSTLFFIGLILSLIAPVIQFLSDKQMYDFRAKNTDKNKVINTGLWRFSRHPNYFGELLFWVGIYIMYLSYAGTININILYPIAMILLFIFISIPMMENRLVNRPGYKAYQNSVSMILPFLPKKKKSSSVSEEKA